jgi:hypothetical protein
MGTIRKLIGSAAIGVATTVGGTGIAGAAEPDHQVRRGDTLSDLRPHGWQYACVVNIAEGRIVDCDTIATGQWIRLHVPDQERRNIDAWLAAAASAGPAPPPAAPAPAAEPAHCAGLDGINEPLASKTCTAIRHSGGACRVVSGYRSYTEQAELYRRYLDGTGNLAAPPGRSNHNHGDAVDMTRDCAPHMRAQGLVTPVPGEPWHWELP